MIFKIINGLFSTSHTMGHAWLSTSHIPDTMTFLCTIKVSKSYCLHCKCAHLGFVSWHAGLVDEMVVFLRSSSGWSAWRLVLWLHSERRCRMKWSRWISSHLTCWVSSHGPRQSSHPNASANRVLQIHNLIFPTAREMVTCLLGYS